MTSNICEKTALIIAQENLNITKLAEKLLIPRETLSRIIHGKRHAGKTVAPKLIQFLLDFEGGTLDIKELAKPKKPSEAPYVLKENEVWIKGFEGKYSVDTDGQIYSVKHGGYLQGYTNTKGYRKVDLGGKQIYCHRIVALAFIPNPDGKPQVNHKDGNKQNNTVENLEWCTPQENMTHAVKMGLIGKKSA